MLSIRTTSFFFSAALVLGACSDSLVSSNNLDHETGGVEISALSKKGDKGKPPTDGGGSDAFPTWSSVTVTSVSASEATNWFDDSFMTLPIEFSRYLDTDGAFMDTAEAFFGCPLGDTVPCYEIVLTVDQAQADDKAAIRFYPMEEDARCIGGICPVDASLDDGSEMPDRRLFSLFDDYLGTPYVPFSVFDAESKSFTFYWQGQYLRVSDNGTSAVGYFRFDRDPDDVGADLLRASGSFIDASNPNAGDNVDVLEIDRCASANPISSDNSGCIFRHNAVRLSTAAIAVYMSGFDVIQGRGRNKSSSIKLNTQFTVGGESREYLYVVYLVEHVLDGVQTRSAFSTGDRELSIPANPGCISIRPVQAELYALSDNDFSAAFSANDNGFVAVFDVSDSGDVTRRLGATDCAG